MIRYLAESYDYKVTAEDEQVYLEFKNDPAKESVIIGDFYGNPHCAIILEDEDYVVMGGEGLIIYKIEEPFEFYHYSQNEPAQFKELFRGSDCWWIKGIFQDSFDYDGKSFSFLALNKEGYALYKMNAFTLEMEKIGAFEDLPK
ncbi:hypothetical protein FEDK69T_02480 [Flavobacterium enshiense DK69]|uniref:hypothetical protein n=1 Tax=Flavobacterium enshiense TaxID=1341165 RepID=UPI0003C59B38|nr:hypothetical protein [Flavobacterium enshiense]ESU25058.1 hypothetical protein FEDK69T_02480 [Flavobacterium enshiense DK69]